MIKFNTERCNGCGACVEICPTAAIYLVEGKATVESALCRDCQACIAACPTEAISPFTPAGSGTEPIRIPALRPEPEVIQVQTQPTPAPFRTSLLPIIGTSLAWGWREIVPRLADYFLHDLDRRATGSQTLAARQSKLQNGSSARGRGSGRRERRRRRGGR